MNTNLPSSSSFQLKGTPSMLIGLYLCIGGFLVQQILVGYETEDSFFLFLSIENIEWLISLIYIVIAFLSMGALFFNNRRKARKLGKKIWNKSTRSKSLLFIGAISSLFLILWAVISMGETNWIATVFLIGYGILFLLFNSEKKNSFYLAFLGSCSFGIATIFLPHFWLYGILGLGLIHMILGLKR